VPTDRKGDSDPSETGDRRSGSDRRSGLDRRSGDRRRSGSQRRSGTDRRSGKDRRQGLRVKKRIPCEIQINEQWQQALVLDVSWSGLFVQTRRSIDPGAEVGIRLRLPGRSETIELLAAVARARRVPPRLASVAQAGLGLRIRTAPNAYYEFVAEFSPDPASPATPKPGPSPEPARPQPKFKVHAQQTGSPRSRTLTVAADSPEQAETSALRQLGEGWTVRGVERT
jgi:hypothetical protein